VGGAATTAKLVKHSAPIILFINRKINTP